MDAETYLRCRLEDAVTGRESRLRELSSRARAAVAVGAIAPADAETVLADARRAVRVRSPQGDGHDDDGEQQTKPPRVVVCPTVIGQEWGSMVITHIVFGEHGTTLGVHGELVAGRPRMRGPHDMPWELLDIGDSSGTTMSAHFSGSSSDTTFDGEFGVYPSLDVEATAITVAGRTIELASRVDPPTFRIDPLADLSPQDRATRHLELLGGEQLHRHEDDDRAARETFTALGLDVGPGALPGAAVPAAALFGRRGAARGRRARGPQQERSRGRWIGLGSTTPGIDGLVLTLVALSDAGELSFVGRTFGGLVNDGSRPTLRIDAVDDLGDRYSLEPSQSSRGNSEFSATMTVMPALNQKASSVTLGVDTLCHRLELDVPLDWKEVR